jgi:5-methylcytosine-specific restriction enzyme subunit McrC
MEAAALAETGAVDAATDLAGRTRLTSSSYVGVVRVGDVELRITPKLRIHRLLWMVGYAGDPTGWRDHELVELREVDDLIAAIGVSFVSASNRALARGVLRSYRLTEDTSSVLRGRLREADQIRSQLALAVPLEVRYDDYSADIPENQLLLTAALRLQRVPNMPARTLGAIHRLIAILSEVTALLPGQQLPPTVSDQRNRHYQPAVTLARLILKGRSLDQPVGNFVASGFLFNLNQVFQDWLATALGEALRYKTGRLRAQWLGSLDVDGRIRLIPDLVWELGGRPAAVLDAKYKALHGSTSPNADLYQMLAYCTVLNLRLGHLVYAAGDEVACRHLVRQTDTTLQIWALHLDAAIPDVLQEVRDLAEAVVASVGGQNGNG